MNVNCCLIWMFTAVPFSHLWWDASATPILSWGRHDQLGMQCSYTNPTKHEEETVHEKSKLDFKHVCNASLQSASKTIELVCSVNFLTQTLVAPPLLFPCSMEDWDGLKEGLIDMPELNFVYSCLCQHFLITVPLVISLSCLQNLGKKSWWYHSKEILFLFFFSLF